MPCRRPRHRRPRKPKRHTRCPRRKSKCKCRRGNKHLVPPPLLVTDGVIVPPIQPGPPVTGAHDITHGNLSI